MKPGKIILITIDTLRADRLGCYGRPGRITPNIDRLAGEGVAYRWAFSPGVYTVPVHASILTGLYPSHHGLGFKQRSGRLDPDNTLMLQELLRERGYAAAAFVSAFVLRKEWGLCAGFDVYDDEMTGSELNRPTELIRDGRRTNAVALGWVRENRERDFFLWVHYFDVHGPYVQPDGFEGPFGPEAYGDSPVPLKVVPNGYPGGIPEYQVLDAERDEAGVLTGCNTDLRRYLAGYDNGVNYEDTVVGELLDGLKAEGVYDDSMILLTSDHGEALGEGGVYFFHGLTTGPEQGRVPLILKMPPGADPPEDTGNPVSTADIMPTVLDVVGRPAGGLGMDGVSLFSPDPDRLITCENEWQRSVIGRGRMLTRPKAIPYDGFEYYFDSEELCRGETLLDYRTGEALPADADGPAEPLAAFADMLDRVSDPVERLLRERDREIEEKDRTMADKDRTIAEKDRAIYEKNEAIAYRDEVIEFKQKEVDDRDRTIDERNGELFECGMRLKGCEGELASVYGSRSWRLTYPLRWVTGRLKGIKAG